MENTSASVAALMTRSAQLELWAYFRSLCDWLLDPALTDQQRTEVQAEQARVRLFIFTGDRHEAQ